VRANIAEDADCRRMAEAALAKWGRIDALVNNAGTTKVAFNHADLNALSAADFQHVYGVNVVGAFQMIRAVEPAMRKQGGGAVVNVSSIAAVMGIGTSVAYAASKGALNTMTLSLARALGPQIRINAVCPGFVETRWLQEALGPAYEGAKAGYMSNAALRKVCTPDDIARAVLWLLEGSELVTGEFILDEGALADRHPFLGRRQICELQRGQARVQLVRLQQFRVRADRDDPSVIEHDDPIRFQHRCESMRDDDRRPVLHQLFQRLLHIALALRVERAGCFVEQQDRRVSQQRAGDGDALALAAGQSRAALAQERVIAFGQLTNERVSAGGARRGFDLGVACARPSVANVLARARAEQHRLLRHQADTLTQVFGPRFRDVDAVDDDAARQRIVKAQQQLEGRALAGA